ncbi:hypothetical protein FRB98_001449 [Tulasnella sp. 332]|nr:hypothetical protein FRB98_001449 [Tulasnella sp. 332]
MLGIGADMKEGPDAVAWKQNQEFEAVLSRLNKGKCRDTTESLPVETSERDDLEEEVETSASRGVLLDDKEQGRRRKEDRRRRKEERAKRKTVKAELDGMVEETSDGSGSASAPPPPPQSKPPGPQRMAHRARYRAAKSMVGASASAMAEILGESSTATTPIPSIAPSATLTPIYDDTPEQANNLITASTTNIADYFKQKMQAKLGIVSTPKVLGDNCDLSELGAYDGQSSGIGSGSKGLGWAALAVTEERSAKAGEFRTTGPEMRQNGEKSCGDGKRKKKRRAAEDSEGVAKERKKRRNG